MKKKKSVKKKEEHPIIKEKKHKARRRSIREGIFATAQFAFGNNYLSPFAIAINASNSMIAMIGSLGGILGPMSQLFSSRLIEKHSRKKIVLRTVFWESLLWLPMIIIATLYYKGIITTILPLFFMLFFAIHLIVANIAGPAWFSWMGDLVDKEYRGRWFAKRNLIHGFTSIFFAIIAAFFLDYFKSLGWIMFGFIILFALAMIARLLSWQFFKSQYEPKLKLKKGYYFSFGNFLFNSPKNNFGKFTIFRGFLAFSQAIAAPLIVVYLLRNLQFSYVSFMIITMTGSVFALLMMELWGKFADRYGNYRTMILSSFFIPAIPVLWIINHSLLYLILVPSIIGSIAWAGFNLAAGNFIYDNVSQERRGLIISYYNMFIGIGTFLGAGLGAILIKYITTTTITPIAVVFIVSTICRLLTVVIGLPHLKEVRDTEEFSGKSAFKNIIMKEGVSTLAEEFHQVMSIKKYLTAK